jgi:hypothetical protein
LTEKLGESLLRSVSELDNVINVSSETEEIIRLCEALPENKPTEVTDFARFLLAQQNDARWEQLLDDKQPRPKLEKFVREALAEGSEPLDLDRL